MQKKCIATPPGHDEAIAARRARRTQLETYETIPAQEKESRMVSLREEENRLTGIIQTERQAHRKNLEILDKEITELPAGETRAEKESMRSSVVTAFNLSFNKHSLDLAGVRGKIRNLHHALTHEARAAELHDLDLADAAAAQVGHQPLNKSEAAQHKKDTATHKAVSDQYTAKAYRAAREAEYPPIGDVLDEVCKVLHLVITSGVEVPPSTLALLKKRQAVKEKHPKPVVAEKESAAPAAALPAPVKENKEP